MEKSRSKTRSGMGVASQGGGDYMAMNVPGTSAWKRNFIIMGIAFAINHGCVTSVLGLASSDFSTTVASTSSAMLYAMYTISALLFAVPTVLIKGPKFVLCAGTFLYCIYVIPFAILTVGGKHISETGQVVLVVVGSAIGGLGAGWLWTAQG